MTSRHQDERSALLFLFLVLVVGLGLMFGSRQARDNAAGASKEARPPSTGERGCAAGEIDVEEAIAGGDLLAGAGPASEPQPGATGTSGSRSLSVPVRESKEGVSSVESAPREEPTLPQMSEASQLPITLMLSPGIPGRGSEGHVRVLGYEAGSPNGPGTVPAFTWRSGLNPSGWPLRVDAQVPLGLDLRVVYEPLGDLPAVTGAVRPRFSPQGELELLYQLDRLR